LFRDWIARPLLWTLATTSNRRDRWRVWLWVLGGFVLIVILCVCRVRRVRSPRRRQYGGEVKYAVVVTYRVEGSGSSVAITYTVGIAGTAKDTATNLPWTKDVSTGGTVSLTAMNDQSGGTITCRIFVNGKQISEQTATGPLTSARCIGDVGLLPAR
jgi:hypothetical protein